MTMGEYIRQLRIERGMSQEDLGKIVGVNRAAVQKWEKGSVENIKRSTIKKLSQVFNVSPCDLMKWDDEENSSRIVQPVLTLNEQIEQAYGKDVLDLLNKIRKLDSVDRAMIQSGVDALLNQDKYSTQEGLKNA